MSGGGVFQKPDVGFGVGVKPTEAMTGLSVNTTTTKTPQSWFSGPNMVDPGVPQLGYDPIMQNPQVSTIDSGSVYSSRDILEGQGRYDRAEARRQEKLDAMAELAQGQGDRVQAPRPPGQGQPGQFQVKSTPMVELKRRFPSLVQTEGSLNPFLGRRYNK
jgi:hypothetical protein